MGNLDVLLSDWKFFMAKGEAAEGSPILNPQLNIPGRVLAQQSFRGTCKALFWLKPVRQVISNIHINIEKENTAIGK